MNHLRTPAAALVVLLVAAAAEAQIGPRTLSNSISGNLDTAKVGNQLSISASDKTTQKMELVREVQYWEPLRWQGTSVTWVKLEQAADGTVVVREEGSGRNGGGVIRELKPTRKWQVEPLADGSWKLSSEKGGKLDFYLETVFNDKPFTVAAVVPKFDGEAYGAVYRGLDFLFFVVQKKHPSGEG